MPAFMELQAIDAASLASIGIQVPPFSGGGDVQTQTFQTTNPLGTGGGAAATALGAIKEMTAQQPIVMPATGGAPWEFAEVLKIESSSSITPGRAFISVRNLAAKDESGPITMSSSNAFSPKKVKYWSRISIVLNGATIFTGALLKRRDVIGGNSIVLEYWDDRWLLSGIPLRGCLVNEPQTDGTFQLKLLPRLAPHCNPNGLKNATRLANNSNIYVFILPAERGTLGKDDESSVGNDDGQAGVAVYWTPERWLTYLWYVATQFNPTGVNASYAATTARLDTSKLTWNQPTFQDGTMRTKMPDTSFRGMTVLGAIKKALDISGEYELAMDYSSNYLTTYITSKGASNANNAGAIAGKTLTIQRSGAVTDLKSIFDGTAEVDASEFKPAVLAEGAPERIEARHQYSNGTVTVGGTNVDTLTPAWTNAEQSGFLTMIKTGCQVTPVVSAAGVITAYNSTTTDIPGGSSGSFKNTLQALKVARASFPRVFRAFQLTNLNSYLDTIMKGANNLLLGFPYHNAIRVPLQEQLQPYYEDNTTSTARGRMRLPIRIQLSTVATNNSTHASDKDFRDVTFNCGLRITNDGLIWFDGLTDDLAGVDNLYTNSLVGYTGVVTNNVDTTLPVLKSIRVNMAIEHDKRLYQVADLYTQGLDPNNIADVIDGSLAPSTGPRLQHYTVNPEGFVREHQTGSYPALDGSIVIYDPNGNRKALTTPINNNLVYDNSTQLSNAAARTHKDVCRLKKSNTFKLPGIRIDLNTGDYLDKIQFVNDGTAGDEFKLSAPIDKLEYDFRAQETVVTTQ